MKIIFQDHPINKIGFAYNINKLMQKDTAYVNKLVKKKEHERSMQYHLQNLKNTKPITRPLQGFDISINKMKKQYQNEIRFTEIERQNRILLQKISGIMNKTKRGGSSFTEHHNKSLNSTFRKKQNQNIEIQNAKMLKRLQQKKPNYDTQKLNRDWVKQKNVMKIMSNYPFMLSDRPKHKRNSTSNIEKQRRFQIMQPIQLVRMRVINGVSFLVTIQLSSKMMKITGDCKQRKQIKVIQIQRNQAIQFIQQECQSKLEEVFNHLRYDKEEGVLYLVGNEVELEQLIAKQKEYYGKKQNKEEQEEQEEVEEQGDEQQLDLKDEVRQNKEEQKKEQITLNKDIIEKTDENPQKLAQILEQFGQKQAEVPNKEEQKKQQQIQN